jgi:hypothetical protein
LTEWLKLSAVADGRYERFDPSSVLPGAASIPPGSRIFGAGGVEARILTQTLRLAVIPSLRLEAAKDTITRPERYRLMGADTQPATYWLPNHAWPLCNGRASKSLCAQIWGATAACLR